MSKKHSEKNILRDFRSYGIGLVFKYGLPLMMLASAGGVLKAQTAKSNDQSVRNAVSLMDKKASYTQALSQYVKDSTYIARNFSAIKAHMTYEEQKKYQRDIYVFSNEPLKEAEAVHKLRLAIEASGGNKVPSDEQTDFLKIQFETYGRNAGKQLRSSIKNLSGEYKNAVAGLSEEQKAELNDIQKQADLVASAAADPNSKAALQLELQNIGKTKIANAEKNAELDTLLDMYMNAFWMDRMPKKAIGAAANAVRSFRLQNNENETDTIISRLNEFYVAAQRDADKFSIGSPANAAMERAKIVAEIKVQMGEASRVNENLNIYGAQTAKALELISAGKKAEAVKIIQVRNETINARPERLSQEAVDGIRTAAIKEVFDYNLEIVRNFQEEIKASRKVIAEGDYKIFEDELGVPANSDKDAPIISVAEKRDIIGRDIEFLTEKAGKESAPEYKRILEKQLKERQSELKELDNMSRNYVERNRSEWLENNDNLYANAVEDERIYLDARSGLMNTGKTYTVTSDEIAFRNNKSSTLKGRIDDKTRAQYSSEKDRYVIYHSYKGKYSHAYSGKYLTQYGTGSYANAAHSSYRHVYGHNGRTGGEYTSYKYFGVSASENDMYLNVNASGSMSSESRGKGREGLKNMTKGIGNDALIIILNKLAP